MELKDGFVGRVLGQTYHRVNETESYVEVPPALLIMTPPSSKDSRGDCWTLGFEYTEHGQRFNWNVLRNDLNTGEQAERITYRAGKLKIHGWYGSKTWNGRSFV
jgi:hypothetical protein